MYLSQREGEAVPKKDRGLYPNLDLRFLKPSSSDIQIQDAYPQTHIVRNPIQGLVCDDRSKGMLTFTLRFGQNTGSFSGLLSGVKHTSESSLQSLKSHVSQAIMLFNFGRSLGASTGA